MYGFEFKKVWTSKIFIIMFAGLLLINNFMYVSSQREDRRHNIREYISLIEKYKDSDLNEAENILSERLSLENSENAYVYSQIEYINGYREWIDDIENKKDSISKFSIFADKESFSNKNIKKTAKDFRKNKDIKLRLGNDFTITSYVQYNGADIWIIVLLMLAAVIIFYEEYEKNMTSVIRCTKYGRKKLQIQKIKVMLTMSLVLSAIFYADNVIMSLIIYGETDWSRSIQSIEEFGKCTYMISVGQYVILLTIIKVITMAILSAFISSIFVNAKNIIKIIAIVVVLFGAGACMYNGISVGIWAGPLKIMNIYSVVKINDILGGYENVAFLNTPVNSKVIYVSMLLILITASGIILMTSFNKYEKKSNILRGLTDRILRTVDTVSVPFNGIIYELYKTQIKTGMWILIVLAIAAGISMIDTGRLHLATDDYNYHIYAMNYAGRIDRESVNTMDDLLDTTYDESSVKAIKEVRKQMAYTVSLCNSKGIKEAYLTDYTAIKYLFKNNNSDYKRAAIITAIIIIISVYITGMENRYGMYNVINDTKRGWRYINRNKYIIMFAITVFVTAILYIPSVVTVVVKYKYTDFSVNLISAGIECVPGMMNWTIRRLIILQYAVDVYVTYMIALLSIETAQYVKSTGRCMSVLLAVFVCPIIMPLIGVEYSYVGKDIYTYGTYTSAAGCIVAMVYIILLCAVRVIIPKIISQSKVSRTVNMRKRGVA